MEKDRVVEVIDLYSGYEGEPEIVLSADNMQLRMWDGYFDPIMDIAFYKELEDYEEAFGVVGEYQTCTGWCDIHARKTIVENPEMELKVLESMDVKKGLEQYFQELGDEYKADIIRVYDIILNFFRLAEGTVYIEEE